VPISDCCTWRDSGCKRPTPGEAADHAAERADRFPWWPVQTIRWNGGGWAITAERSGLRRLVTRPYAPEGGADRG
jgi:hypothetical protein